MPDIYNLTPPVTHLSLTLSPALCSWPAQLALLGRPSVPPDSTNRFVNSTVPAATFSCFFSSTESAGVPSPPKALKPLLEQPSENSNSRLPHKSQLDVSARYLKPPDLGGVRQRSGRITNLSLLQSLLGSIPHLSLGALFTSEQALHTSSVILTEDDGCSCRLFRYNVRTHTVPHVRTLYAFHTQNTFDDVTFTVTAFLLFYTILFLSNGLSKYVCPKPNQPPPLPQPEPYPTTPYQSIL